MTAARLRAMVDRILAEREAREAERNERIALETLRLLVERGVIRP